MHDNIVSFPVEAHLFHFLCYWLRFSAKLPVFFQYSSSSTVMAASASIANRGSFLTPFRNRFSSATEITNAWATSRSA